MKNANIKFGAVALGLALSLASTAAIAQSPATPSTERLDDTNIHSGSRMAGGSMATTTSSSRPVSTTTGTDVKWDNKDTKAPSQRLDNSSLYNPTPANEGNGTRVNNSAR